MGQFGLWTETGRLNDIIKEGVRDGLGWGEAVGRYIWEEKLPNREKSVLGMGYHLGVPCTVHIGVGNDIIHEHPNCDGAAMGEASYNDFLIYAQSVTKLEHGVFLNFGSAVAGPEVYLKALAMARNVARRRGGRSPISRPRSSTCWRSKTGTFRPRRPRATRATISARGRRSSPARWRTAA